MPLDEGTDRRLLQQLLLLLAEEQHHAARRVPDNALLSKAAASLFEQSSAVDTAIGRAVGAAALALKDLAELWRSGAARADDQIEPEGAAPAKLIRPIPERVLRHAARISIAVVISYAIAVWLNLTFSYWATMATVVVLQPLAVTTWPRRVRG